ncbi:PREDICTED: pre-mRNA-splicing factor 18 [Nicrophorus vespilloides]|uniref:Pre-mRNA-splicing factor 18 n=1 Tax=Nicrophorus vespilloides TaxID=110193 RepID=A0ABM1M3G1_NICVS|nr:PREDICTED: pre-mRNA-splicing factor 18 [Nicrophorus vespilloides]
MDVLKAELAKKRKMLEDMNLISTNKKYFKRGDLIAKEAEEYHNQCGTNFKESAKSEENENKVYSSSEVDSSEANVLPRQEVISRLRDRSEPISLFGESELDAFRRLRRCEILEPEVNKGFRNDFQEAMEQVDQEYLDELISGAGSNKNKDASENKSQEEELKSYDEIKEMAVKMGKGDRDHDMNVIMKFLELLLKMWQDQLQTRSAQEKRGTKGKLAGATCTQTQVYLKPLLRKLRTHTLPEDISDSLTEIVQHLLNRNYLKASDAYLQMAIGNAPWPIGVTMVGIHARTGREKIFSKNVAHVMNDETQRKYIQALKRLMTKCQEYFPTDPSRCVEYAAPSTSN